MPLDLADAICGSEAAGVAIFAVVLVAGAAIELAGAGFEGAMELAGAAAGAAG